MSNKQETSKKREIPKIPSKLGIKNALRINAVSLPWQRALGSVLATCSIIWCNKHFPIYIPVMNLITKERKNFFSLL